MSACVQSPFTFFKKNIKQTCTRFLQVFADEGVFLNEL